MSSEGQVAGNANLQKQDLTTLDITKLTPLSPEVISRQATINIGTIGHVAHGKSTVVKAISGVHTVRFKNELERNITIKLVADDNDVDKTTTSTTITTTSTSQSLLHSHASPPPQQQQNVARKHSAPTASPEGGGVSSMKQPTLMSYWKKPKLDLPNNTSTPIRRQTSPSHDDDATEYNARLLARIEPSNMRLAPLVHRLTTDTIADIQRRLRTSSAGDHPIDSANSNDDRSSTVSTDTTSTIIADLEYLHRLATQRSTNAKRPAAAAAATALSPAANAAGSGKTKKPTAAVSAEEYTVERIVRLSEIVGAPHFLVKWKGWSEQNNTWEPFDHVRDCESFKQFLVRQTHLFRSEIEEITAEDENGVIVDRNEPPKSATGKEDPPDDVILERIRNFDELRVQSNLLLLALLRRNSQQRSASYTKLMASTRADLELLPWYLRRMQQLDRLRTFENTINAVDKSSNLTVENLVDLEGPPERFRYINDVFAGDGVHIPTDPIIGCECASTAGGGRCNYRSKCCANHSGGQFAYNKRRRLRVPRGTPIFECNRRCACDADCPNRVVQRGRKHSLCIYRTANGCGWGVRTLRPIWPGQFICEYVGEVLTYEETERRGRIYDAEGRTYLFDLDMNSRDNPYTIDAAHHGNVSHFINHSCDPNCGVWAVWIDCMDMDLPRIALFAMRKIEAGEALSFDYMNQTVATTASKLNASGDVEMDETTNASVDADSEGEQLNGENVETNVALDADGTLGGGGGNERRNIQMECRCGSAKCRKFVF